MLCDKLRVFVSRIFRTPLLSCGSLADSLLQLSFVLALLRLNSVIRDFLVTTIALCPLALSRFGTLAEFCTVAEYSFGLLADS